MAQIVTVTESKDQKPPSTWGVVPWKMPDGMTAETAQAVMRAFVVYTHSEGALCGELHIPRATARVYLERANSIPKRMALRIPRLIAAMQKNPAHMQEIIEQSKQYSASGASGFAIKLATELNDEAKVRAGKAFREERLRREMTGRDVGEICGVSSSIVTERERTGYTPSMTGFFKLCETWDIEPERFGFASNQAALIASWRRNRRARK
jgi:hypothetical protein